MKWETKMRSNGGIEACTKVDILASYVLPYQFYHKMEFLSPKIPLICKSILCNSAITYVYLFQKKLQKSGFVLTDRCRFLGLFQQGKNSIL